MNLRDGQGSEVWEFSMHFKKLHRTFISISYNSKTNMLKLMLLNMIWFKGESRLDLDDIRKIKWGLKLNFFKK
jgi:hypothetical protein